MFTKSNIMFERFVKFVENVYPVLKSACLKYDNHVKVNNMVVYKKWHVQALQICNYTSYKKETSDVITNSSLCSS